MRSTRPDRIKEAIRLAVEEYDRQMRKREMRREAQRKKDLRRERNSWLGSLMLVAVLSFAGGRWTGSSSEGGGGFRVIRVNPQQERASAAAYLTRQLREGRRPPFVP